MNQNTHVPTKEYQSDSTSGYLASGSSEVDLSDKFIPNPEIYYQEGGFSISSETISVPSHSKRPLHCPKGDCSKCIFMSSLESHFIHDHREVPQIVTELDTRNSMEFDPLDVIYFKSQCMVLMYLSNYDFSNISPSTSQSSTSAIQANTKPIIILLVTRIVSCDLNEYRHHQGSSSSLHPGDKVIIWMASNICTNLSYSVAVSTLSNNMRQKFYGPMLRLGSSPTEVCGSGKCLILTHYHVNKMTENGTLPLILDFVIHSPD